MSEKKKAKPSYLEMLQNRRADGDTSAQQKINDYFWPKKKRAERKKNTRKQRYND